MAIRINKYLSRAGICSRREADRAVLRGEVSVDGHTARMGERVGEDAEVYFRGERVEPEMEEVLLAFHKPAGIVCTSEKKEKDNIIDFISYPKRIYPVGRLDKDSEGLIFLTNRGDLVNRMLRPGNFHEKEYLVTVDRDIDGGTLHRLSKGVYLKELDVTTRPCRVERGGGDSFSIVLTQGYNRQIRRMCEACGYRVMRLIRVRIMDVCLGDLKAGEYRELREREREHIYSLTADSRDIPGMRE